MLFQIKKITGNYNNDFLRINKTISRTGTWEQRPIWTRSRCLKIFIQISSGTKSEEKERARSPLLFALFISGAKCVRGVEVIGYWLLPYLSSDDHEWRPRRAFPPPFFKGTSAMWREVFPATLSVCGTLSEPRHLHFSARDVTSEQAPFRFFSMDLLVPSDKFERSPCGTRRSEW